ncbi:sec-independent protein translocase protein TatB [Streptoalloteichus tenebrarius]|uniref:Sec-independent protein translocase protein TatB n=1 Tax=Streptoalloteichus tenebrarius (strain ATCC 17920 / DSM 40477 / JCM 4838 / CBS 697.72 / NBRC 16177 / NCIMB 11028 / NRRL B-12390 / A12253. 1 / ISP 5477) TaxID=1933 RepID=A0ABT1I280_STRSD|nr:sec-independent translocase [Streptoalloteichus tenebrarius]MCP2261892.1 sec-independent protein translocase protein TatB [Streptoalloteichus tenebrarius]
MLENIGWGEILVLVVAGLFILGPERLPSAAAWLGRTVRQVREYATGARQQLRDELGPEFDEIRKPLEDLRELRNFDPKRAVTRHLLDDGDSDFRAPDYRATNNGYSDYPPPAPRPAQKPLQPHERPPFDPDAT